MHCMCGLLVEITVKTTCTCIHIARVLQILECTDVIWFSSVASNSITSPGVYAYCIPALRFMTSITIVSILYTSL